MKIVISGASGLVGSEVVPILVELGHTLLLISRDVRGLKARFPELKSVSLEAWEKEAKKYDVFLHLAVMNNNQTGSFDDFHGANADLTSRFAVGARRSGIPRFIYPSTVQTLLPGNKSHYVESKMVAEQSIQEHFLDFAEIVYLGLVHGKKYSGKLSSLNWLPSPVAQFFFSLFSALKPTTGAQLLVDYVTQTENFSESRGLVLTDPKGKNHIYRLWQRTLNVSFVVAVLLLSPILLAVWLAIIATNGRPGFFLQKRIGRGGGQFLCAKFRTMKNGTETIGTHLVSEQSVTAVGKFLRRFKIDELPQAINVASGQMNLIGSRPSLPSQQDVIRERTARGVIDHTPGLTGWAQVNGVDMSNPEKIAEYDAQYVALQSVWLDTLIMKRTLFSVKPTTP